MRSDKEPPRGLFHCRMLAGSPELKVRADQSFDCSCLTPSGGLVSSPYLPSLASRSNTREPPDLLSRFRAKLTMFPPLATRFSLSLFIPLFFLVSVFTSQPHFSPCSLGFFLPPPVLCSLAFLCSTPPLSHRLSLIHSHLTSSLFGSDLFFFSQFPFLSLSLSLFIPPYLDHINRASRGNDNGLLPLTLLQTHY